MDVVFELMNVFDTHLWVGCRRWLDLHKPNRTSAAFLLVVQTGLLEGHGQDQPPVKPVLVCVLFKNGPVLLNLFTGFAFPAVSLCGVP